MMSPRLPFMRLLEVINRSWRWSGGLPLGRIAKEIKQMA